jgi:hypothetical protein
MAVMECIVLSSYDKAADRPPDAPIHWLGVDDDWTHAPELRLLTRVFNQDSASDQPPPAARLRPGGSGTAARLEATRRLLARLRRTEETCSRQIGSRRQAPAARVSV